MKSSIMKKTVALMAALVLFVSMLPNASAAYAQRTQTATEIPFSSASASSELKEGDITFRAGYAIDDKTKTDRPRPWVEGVEGSGIGETLTLRFDGKEWINMLSFRLGYARDQARYDKNNRPKELRVSFSDGTAYNCYFDDINAEQTIRFSETIITKYVKIEISDVFKGTTCDDTCIYQVRAFYVY